MSSTMYHTKPEIKKHCNKNFYIGIMDFSYVLFMVHSQPLKIGLGENAIPHLSMSSDFENLSLQNRNIKAKQKRQYSQSLDLNPTRVSEVI